MSRKQVFTPKMKEFQMQLLHKETQRLKRKLNQQLGLLEDVTRTAEIDTVKKELRTGSEILSELKSAVKRYIDVCNQGDVVDTSDVTIMLEAEEDSFNKVTIAINEWIETKESTEEKSLKEKVKMTTENDTSDNMKLTINLMRLHGQLENQLKLFDDLFQFKDETTIKTELKRLITIFKEMKSISTPLSENLSPVEKEKMNSILADAEHQVQKTRTSTNRILFTIREEDKMSHISHRSRLSTLSKKSKKKCPTVIGIEDFYHKQYLEATVDLEKGTALKQNMEEGEYEPDSRSNKSFPSKIQTARVRQSESKVNSKNITEDIEPHFNQFYMQNDLIRELLLTSNLDMMNKEIKNFDEIYDRILSIYNNVDIMDHADKISDKVDHVDNMMGETKRMITKWMAKQLELDRRSKKSEGSKNSRRSKLSKRSERSRDSKENGPSVELMRKQLSKNKERLQEQRTLVEDLLLEKDLGMMNREMDLMEKLYEHTLIAMEKLTKHVPTNEVKSLSKDMIEENTQHAKMKKQVVRWMIQQDETDSKSVTSYGSKQTSLSDISNYTWKGRDTEKQVNLDTKVNCQGNNGTKNQLEKDVKDQLTRSKSRLENQKDLITKLLNSTERKMLDHELQNLDKKYDDFVATASDFRTTLPQEERIKVSNMIDSEDASVFQLKLKAYKQTNDCNENETQHRNTLQNDDNDPHTEKTIEKTETTRGLVKLNELMIQTLRMQSAPKVEIDIFSGDPLEYDYFMESFKDTVENLVDDSRQRFMRLLNYTDGEAKDLIKHCIHEDNDICYDQALKLLEKEYGSSFKVSCAYMDKLKNWPQIKMNDGTGVRELYRFLLRCSTCQKRGAINLDSPLTIRTIQQILPNNLQDKWTSRVTKIRKSKEVEASFQNFVEFVEEESLILNDPVYSRNVKKTEEKLKTCSTNITTKKDVCPLCKAEHNLDDCVSFKEKGARGKKDFLFKSKLCFACYRTGHGVKECKNKRTCKTCNKDHPTSLHEVSFKVSAVHENNGVGGMCIVLVRMSHKSCPDKEIEVYAMLDECSQGTFVNEDVVDFLQDDAKRFTTITVSTVNSDTTSESFAIEDIIVRGTEKFNQIHPSPDIILPTTYTKKKLPMDEGDIPKAEEISKWTYLQQVADTLSDVKKAPLGLLIGNNCKQAIEPMQVISSQAGGPYAKRTKLGWCVVGSADNTEQSNLLSCNRIRVCSTLRDITGLSPDKTIVLQSKITDDAIGGALQDMWRSDFVERESERKALSREDEYFLKLMGQKVQFKDGHYELPLPLCPTSVNNLKKDDLEKGKVDDVQIIRPCKFGERKNESNKKVVTGKTHVVMPDNYNMALKRLNYLKKRMLKDEVFRKEYTTFMSNLFDKGYASKVPESCTTEQSWWIPHHGVYKPGKKKLRPVFDCSAKVDETSLNSKLIQGPDTSNSLLGVLLRFRKGKISFMADIETMYYQVRVPEEHYKFLRFLWWENGDLNKDPIPCEMRVHPFGAISSKSCVTYALHQTASDNKDIYGEEASDTLIKDFYVDDLLKSLDDEKEVIQLVKNVDQMCTAGGFNLTKFVCGNTNVMKSIPEEKRGGKQKPKSIGGALSYESALGVQYHVENDMLAFKVSFEADDGTRSGCLSTISKIYDPLGIAAPFLLKGKKILQKMTVGPVQWHKQLEEEIRKEWLLWKEDMLLLNDLEIRRCYRSSSFGNFVDVTLHCFSDASFIGYGVVCYLRWVDDEGNVEVSIVMGKSRVSPLKPTTVPRLELTAASVSAKIAALLIEELKIENLETFYWVDNKIVMGYIFNRTRRYKIFVANRVKIIDNYTGGKNWNYVETKENPADFASRGISTKDTEKVKVWLYGPKFLSLKDEHWRHILPETEELENDIEVKAQTAHAVKVTEDMRSILSIMEERISSWHRMKRVVCWIVRFVTRCNKKRRDNSANTDQLDVGYDKIKGGQVSSLVVSEIENAEVRILQWLQKRTFEDDLKVIASKEGRGLDKKEGRLWKLNPFVDNNGVLRVGGRLTLAEESEDFKFPVIVPKQTICTKRLIEWHHKMIEHRGRHSTVGQLREAGYWVVSCGKETSAVIYACVRCRWLRQKTGEQMMSNLPLDRMTTEPPFTYCGLDLFGAIKVKEGRTILKKYGAIFTCLSSRAVHVEMVSSLETDTFIQALIRFIGRRGEVRQIRCDNGSNFVGAENELREAMKEMDHEKIRAFMTENGGDWIVWEKNTPSASHMGGVWERQIRTIKSVLMSLIKSSPRVLDSETLSTFLVEAESIVNSRPLTLENLTDPECKPLTPKQVLTMKSRVVSPPPGVFQKADVYCRKRWRISQHMANAFWTRWRKEYLQLLQERQKWTKERRNLAVGDVVLLKDEAEARDRWPMAKVIEVHPSSDGLIRSVTLRVGNSTFKRPIQKTVLLVEASED